MGSKRRKLPHCVEYPFLFILCNDNLAKSVVRRAHHIGKPCGVQLPCSGDCSPLRKDSQPCSGHPGAVLEDVGFRVTPQMSARETVLWGKNSQCENSLFFRH